MTQINNTRESIIKIYKNNDIIIKFLFRFLIGIITISLINRIPFVNESFTYLKKPIVEVLLTTSIGLVFAFMSYTYVYTILIAYLCLHISASLEIAIFVFVILTVIWLLYIRMAPKENIFIILTIISFYLHIPYIIPLIAGLYFSIFSFIPISIGIFIYSFIPIISGYMQNKNDVTTYFPDIYSSFFNNLEWIVIALVFSTQVIITYLFSKQPVKNAKLIAISLCSIINLFIFLILGLITDLSINIFSLIIATPISFLICLLTISMDVVLDYKSIEKVEFEDENNYYYVKIVPKIYVNKN